MLSEHAVCVDAKLGLGFRYTLRPVELSERAVCVDAKLGLGFRYTAAGGVKRARGVCGRKIGLRVQVHGGRWS